MAFITGELRFFSISGITSILLIAPIYKLLLLNAMPVGNLNFDATSITVSPYPSLL